MGNDLTLRRWEEKDCKLLYDWRNHLEIRKWSFQNTVFPYADHQEWFNRFIVNKDKIGLILECNGVSAGQIRFELTEFKGVLRVSISIAPEFLGKGLGTALLKLACNDEGVKQLGSLIVAETMLENVPSQRIFEKSAFINSGPGMHNDRSFIYWTRFIRKINVSCLVDGEAMLRAKVADFLISHQIEILDKNADIDFFVEKKSGSDQLIINLLKPSLDNFTDVSRNPFVFAAQIVALLMQEK